MENRQYQQWYSMLSEQQRQCIFSALSENQRRQAFEYGLTVTWSRLPQYARDLVVTEFHVSGGAQ